MKRITVSIGIPAYNEEANIKQLLTALLAQKQLDYILKEIIVMTDGCTDNTVNKIKSIKSNLIKLQLGENRMGQQFRQNQILRLYKGKILIIMEADTLPKNENTINELIKPLLDEDSKKIGMVVGFFQELKPKTFFEKIIFNNNRIKRQIFDKLNGGINIYTTNGHSTRAFTRRLTKKLVWPADVSEDAYAYLRVRKLKLKIIRQTEAVVLMKNVGHFKDRIKQSEKYISGKKYLPRYFESEFIHAQYFIPKSLIIKCILLQLFINPFWTTASVVELSINFLLNFKRVKIESLLNTYQSTKILESQ